MTRKRTLEEIQEILGQYDYNLIDTYRNKELRVIVEDAEGYRYDVVLNYILRGQNVRAVDKSNSLSLYNISHWLRKNKKNIELLEENIYEGNRSQLNFYCHICKDYPKLNWLSVLHDSGCPICAGYQVGQYHSLAYLRPELAEQFHPDNNFTADEVTYGSAKKAYWICPDCGYGKNKEWIDSITHRTTDRGCPSCSGHVVSDRNRLSILYPDVSMEWHPTKNGNLTPYDVAYGSDKKAWWLCKNCKYEWNTVIKSRTIRDSQCPNCSKISKGEKYIESWIQSNIKNLKNIGIDYCQPQAKFPNCKNKLELPYDFGLHFVDDSWFMIEYHGEQHFYPVDFAGKGEKWAKEEFKKLKKRDKIKKKYCKRNNIPLLIIPYWEKKNINEILEKTFFN